MKQCTVAALLLCGMLALPAAGEAAQKAYGPSQARPNHNVEVQLEYLHHGYFEEREIDTYNVHIYQKFKQNGSVSWHKGLTVTRAVGYNNEDGIHRDSNAVGLGPSLMLRWEKPVSGKLAASIDGTGSLMFYNKAHPAEGRAFGFLWRIGPRLTYAFDKSNAVSVGWMFTHSSNGFITNNPGYNGTGFDIGYNHSF